MNNIRIETGGIRLTVNGDESRVIAFNPNDISFAERYYDLLSRADQRIDAYAAREAELDKDTAVDAYGVPTNMPARMALLREACDYVKSEIDMVFGEGTSKAAFGDAYVLDMFQQFFDGITPYIQKARAGKMSKYSGTKARAAK